MIKLPARGYDEPTHVYAYRCIEAYRAALLEHAATKNVDTDKGESLVDAIEDLMWELERIERGLRRPAKAVFKLGVFKMDYIELELYVDDDQEVSVYAPKEQAWAEMMRYVRQYKEDGEVKVYSVKRTLELSVNPGETL